MRQIRKCKIAGQEFKIIWSDLSEQSLFGWCDVDNKTIHICSKLNKTTKIARQTICHEASHALLELSGIRHMKGFKKFEEPVVRLMDNLHLPAIDDITDRLNQPRRRKANEKTNTSADRCDHSNDSDSDNS